MNWPPLLVLGLSLLCQVTAAVLALRLIWITGARWAWGFVAGAVFLMAIRRAVLLGSVIGGSETVLGSPAEFWAESLGLAISILLLLGFAGIAPLFRSIRRSERALQESQQQLSSLLSNLEHQVDARTRELAMANEALREEINGHMKALEMYERDRKLVAYEIHDGFIQKATAALMNLQASTVPEGKQPAEVRKLMDQGVALLRDGIAEARSLIGGLRPAILDDFGTIAALEQLVEEARSRTGVEIEWSHCVKFDRLATPLETAIFRIVQESLNNALRYSKSDRVRVEVMQTNGRIRILVEDWGCGFDPQNVGADHYGLEGVAERARLLGGASHFHSAPGKGTRITVDLPLLGLAAHEQDTAR